uniref:Uncharacterized protein n=1 Tax=Photinus pyralis TaxID=7054 RepID=A0A1Y1LMF2_PHOPY
MVACGPCKQYQLTKQKSSLHHKSYNPGKKWFFCKSGFLFKKIDKFETGRDQICGRRVACGPCKQNQLTKQKYSLCHKSCNPGKKLFSRKSDCLERLINFKLEGVTFADGG